MAASDHLHPKLFHSSPHLFSKGDLVKPGVPGAIGLGGNPNTPGHAYATSDPEMAHFIAEQTEVGWINEVEAPHGKTNVLNQLVVNGFTKKDDSLFPWYRSQYKDEYASPVGFVATGKATFVTDKSKSNASTPGGWED